MEEKVARDQKKRLEMIGTSVTNYLFCAAGLTMYATAGTIPWRIPGFYLVVVLLGNMVFIGMIRTHANLSLREPNMFTQQMAFGALVALGFLYLAPQVAFVFLTSLFVTGVFGLVQFDVNQLRTAWLAIGAGTAVVFMLVGQDLSLPASNTQEVILLWVFLLLVLGRFSMVGAHVSFLRQRLHQRNRQLQESLDRIQQLMSERAREEQELAIAQERQRIMREIHDGVGANLITSLAMLEHRQLDQQGVELALRECIDYLMLTVDSLELLENDVVALIATLRYRLEKRLLAAGIQMEWHAGELPPLPWLEANQTLSLMRLLQETLANIVKHAKATRVQVTTRERDIDGRAGVEVIITDNGSGFDHSVRSHGGHGLGNMYRRAEDMGGRLIIESEAGKTSVALWLPINNQLNA